jgi:hypothetical protein
MNSSLVLTLLPETLAICRLPASAALPAWALRANSFFAIVKTTDEISIVCPQNFAPADVQCHRDWAALKVEGPLDFSLTGILASLAQPLAQAKLSLFAISTFDTDYVLVKKESLEQALTVLKSAGHRVK